MSVHGSDTGEYSAVGTVMENPERRSHETNVENPLVQRIQLKFRQAVGRAMEEIADKEIREGIKKIQQEVVTLLRKLQEEAGLNDKALQLFEDEIIRAKVNAFIAMTALSTEREILRELKRENKSLKSTLDSSQEELRREMYDELTGLLRKKYFLSGFRKTLSLLQREAFTSPVPIALMFFDVDHFKNVNDTYGHQVGDTVLKRIGKIAQDRFQRESDTSGRYGGEEFVVVMPKCDMRNAALIAEDLRKQIEAETFTTFTEDGRKIEFNVTASVGVLSAVLHRFPNDDFEKIIEGMLKQADALMYEGKQSGRNKISVRQIDIGEILAGDDVIG